MLSDYVLSVIRTWVPVLVASALVFLAREWNIGVSESTSAALTTNAIAVVTLAYYALVRLAERRWPKIGWLLGAARTPTYSQEV